MNAVLAQNVRQFIDDLDTTIRIDEILGTDLDRTGTRIQEFQHVFRTGDAADADDRDMDRLGTIRIATGLMAGPLRPPVTVARIGFALRRSRRMPISVLMSTRPSAPASSTAFAIATISVTFGVSLT